MLRNLGTQEVESILSERENIEVGCDFAGRNIALMRWMPRRFLRSSKIIRRGQQACNRVANLIANFIGSSDL